MAYLYLAIAIVAEVAGTTALKASEQFTRPLPSLVVVVCYGLAFYMLALVLRTIPVGIAYAIWAGVGILLVALAGAVIYREVPDWPAVIGMTLIVAGVVIINLFSESKVH
ncbi:MULTISPECIES: multidrug efflux SMR transporter [Microbulbifer]|uniref:DMT family transporter n=1 Tax=Microbulbifer TaxID=48073 RepID=UPI001E4BA0D6|nr:MULTISPECIES: multidrug efflux SMR transporter [Microbulbifer]UHQ55206.1 multidrug efflux SMR transporter [Microbulbifer sp. YPW16]